MLREKERKREREREREREKYKTDTRHNLFKIRRKIGFVVDQISFLKEILLKFAVFKTSTNFMLLNKLLQFSKKKNLVHFKTLSFNTRAH